MTTRYPAIEPYESGMLDVGHGHRVYFECCGNPNGKPALFIHGGPGAGCGKGARRYFDPKIYRIVLFDQRGCGRSTPLANDDNADLRTNTTAHLIADIERLRSFLGLETWTICAISWGTTLALAYAQKYPERVDAMVLALVTTTTRGEVEWVTNGLRHALPAEWKRFADAIPAHLRDRSLVDAYATMLFDEDANVRAHAAREWCAWDCAQTAGGEATHDPRFDDAEFRLRFARLVTHYWRHAAFLDDDQLLKNAPLLNAIPGVMIHGRNDVGCPVEIPIALSKCWRASTLQLLDMGHGDDEIFPLAVTAALDGFRYLSGQVS